jgi:hypothetical protein
MSDFYTYPLLGVEEHFANHHFSVEILETSCENNQYDFKFRYSLNEPTIGALINSGKANAAVRIENRAFYKKTFLFEEDQLHVIIPLSEIGENFTFDIRPFVIAIAQIPTYVNTNASSPRSEYSYSLEAGNFLAIADKVKITFDQAFLKFSGSGNFIKLHRLQDYQGMPMLDFHQHAVYVCMSAKDFDTIVRLNSSPGKSALSGVILLPVMLDIVWRIKSGDISAEDWEWVEDLEESIDLESINLLEEIQSFLGNPMITATETVNSLIVDEE